MPIPYKLYIAIALGLLAINTHAQTETKPLVYADFIAQVIAQHPIAQQADRITDDAQASLLGARGGFDPTLSADWTEKNYGDKLYYRKLSGKLTIPTPIGVDVVGGFDRGIGTYLNPEYKTSLDGLWNVGLEANLLQGLWTDQRRTSLRQAKIGMGLAQSQRTILLNDLVLEASMAYFAWQEASAITQVLTQNLVTAQGYYQNIKQTYALGEKTAVDTLEAYLAYQDAQILFTDNTLKQLKTEQVLQNYLWQNGNPSPLPTGAQPALDALVECVFVTDSTPNDNPLIAEKLAKQQYYETELAYKRNKLLPKLKAKFNPLLASTSADLLSSAYLEANYKWGFSFEMPLFLRAARADVKRGKIKVANLTQDVAQKQNEVENKIDATRNRCLTLASQLDTQQRTVAGYEQLLAAEQTKFNYGESSVFLLTKRQEKYLSSQVKMAKTRAALQAERVLYLYLTNGLVSE